MEPLTQCEYQVAHEVAKGHTPSEIAAIAPKVNMDNKGTD